MRKLEKQEVHEMLAIDVVEPAQTEWGSLIVLVPKKDVNLCCHVEYHNLNAVWIQDSYQRPRVEECNDLLSDATIFSTSDATSKYWQGKIAEEDRN